MCCIYIKCLISAHSSVLNSNSVTFVMSCDCKTQPDTAHWLMTRSCFDSMIWLACTLLSSSLLWSTLMHRPGDQSCDSSKLLRLGPQSIRGHGLDPKKVVVLHSFTVTTPWRPKTQTTVFWCAAHAPATIAWPRALKSPFLQAAIADRLRCVTEGAEYAERQAVTGLNLPCRTQARWCLLRRSFWIQCGNPLLCPTIGYCR